MSDAEPEAARLSSTPAGVTLCPLDAIADGTARNFVLQMRAGRFHGFVVRKGEAVHGYVDRCPHAGLPLAQTLLFRVFPGAQRARAIFISAMTTMLAPALGPNLGGFLSDNMSWHWIFLINIPIVVICMLSVATLMRRHETERQKLPIDGIGLGLLILWISCLQLVLDLGRDRPGFNLCHRA